MNIKWLKVGVYVIIPLCFLLIVFEIVGILEGGKAFLYSLSQMPREQASEVIENILVDRLGNLNSEFNINSEMIQTELNKYLDEGAALNTFDKIYIKYVEPLYDTKQRKIIWKAIVALTIANLVTLELVTARDCDRTSC